MQLELAPDEAAILEEILDRTLRDLRVEVRRTSTPAYHDDLQQRARQVEALLERVRAQQAA